MLIRDKYDGKIMVAQPHKDRDDWWTVTTPQGEQPMTYDAAGFALWFEVLDLGRTEGGAA